MQVRRATASTSRTRAAYAQIGYQTAYLKAHYTAEFMAALLSSEIDDGNKRDIMVEHIADARKLGVEVLPPDVNAGEPDFTVEDGKIVFGLTAIKGLGRGAAEEIVAARKESGPFKDLFDFCERVDHKIVPEAAIEKLIKAGALRLLRRPPRPAHARPAARPAGRRRSCSRTAGTASATCSRPLEAQRRRRRRRPRRCPTSPEWPDSEKLKYEKEALDFYISSHPLAQHEDELRRFATHTRRPARRRWPPNQEVILGGMLTQVRFMNTKKARNGNSRYVRCKLEDFTGSAECVMWPDDFVRYKDLIAEDKICLRPGHRRAQPRRAGPDPHAASSTMEQGQRERTTGLVLLLNLGIHKPEHLESVARVLERSRGNLPRLPPRARRRRQMAQAQSRRRLPHQPRQAREGRPGNHPRHRPRGVLTTRQWQRTALVVAAFARRRVYTYPRRDAHRVSLLLPRSATPLALILLQERRQSDAPPPAPAPSDSSSPRGPCSGCIAPCAGLPAAV